MLIVDETQRVIDMARDALDQTTVSARNERLMMLSEFCYSAYAAFEAALTDTADPAKAVDAAANAYREQRQGIIAFRRSRGWPVQEV